MARLYSDLIWRSPPVAAGFYTSDTVPDGEVWIVREVEAVLFSDDTLALQGFQLFDVEGAPIYVVTSPYIRPNVTYHLSTRQVMPAGDELTMQTGDAFWSWRISGYKLTTP